MPELTSLGKWLVGMGLILAVAGVFLWTGGKIPWLGRLPGDIRMGNEHFEFYFPITTCLLISAALSLAIWAFSKFK